MPSLHRGAFLPILARELHDVATDGERPFKLRDKLAITAILRTWVGRITLDEFVVIARSVHGQSPFRLAFRDACHALGKDRRLTALEIRDNRARRKIRHALDAAGKLEPGSTIPDPPPPPDTE